MSAVVDLIAAAMQVSIGLIFATAGFGKLRRWHEFKGMLDAYRLLPSQAVPVAGSFILATEIVTGLALVAGWAVGPFALVAAAMFAGFAIAIAINLLRGRRMIDCGCFRSIRQPLEWRLVVRNGACALLALGSSAFAMASGDPQRWIQAVPAGAALFVIYFALNAVWALDASRAAAFTRS